VWHRQVGVEALRCQLLLLLLLVLLVKDELPQHKVLFLTSKA
jgi:hypothetical protein